MRVLIVDDSLAVRKLLQGVFIAKQWQVLEAANGEEALTVAKKAGKLDLALVDWHMPKMGGIEFIQQLKQLPQFADTVLVMVTTESDMTKMDEAFSHGVAEFITKPFNRDVIEKVIDELFASP